MTTFFRRGTFQTGRILVRRSISTALVALGALLSVPGVWIASGCSATAERGSTGTATSSGSGSSGSTGTGQGGAGPMLAGSGGGSGGAPECGRQNFDIAPTPADILLVLDRSASMEDDPAGGSTKPSKWQIIVPALQQSITATDSMIDWGLKVFPEGESTGQCTTASFPAHILVPIAKNNATAVNQAIAALTDHGDGTPTGDAINNAVTYLNTVQDGNTKFLLLATDGDPSCPSSNAATFAVTAVTAAATAGYKTFVIGVASKASSVKNLTSLAVAGGEAVMSPDPTVPKFYLASDTASLVMALQSITGAAATCIFHLSSAPPAPDHVQVDVGGTVVMKDTTDMNGWDYTGPDMMTIQLFGAACTLVKTAGVSTVHVIFGCKNDPVI
jgi:hypothetical protein